MHFYRGALARFNAAFLASTLMLLVTPVNAGKPDVESAGRKPPGRELATLRAVDKEGQGNVAAGLAWRKVAAYDADRLTEVLAAIDGAEPLAANWIVAAAESIAERAGQQGSALPVADLKSFVVDKKHAPRARRMAFEFLQRSDAELASSLVPGFLHDPSPELRREAVARLLDEAAAAKADDERRAIYREALSGACDLDQVKTVKAALEKLGDKVDLAKHFGFITTWKVIGPFDNTAEAGFDVVYPPEKTIELAASYEGKPREGQPRRVEWQEATTSDEFGVVDLSKALGKENGVVGYAWTEFWSDRRQAAELRAGRDNAIKIWLNGELLYEHGVYHSGADMDQFVARGTLSKGRNTILVKVLQNEQKEDWAQGWGFQLRVCDQAGQAIEGSVGPEGASVQGSEK